MKRFSRVYIEISNICNLQCDFCPEVERKKKVMPFDLFKKIIDEVAPLTEEVTFHLMGEPLAHPQFPEFVEYCQRVGVPINLTTNGTLLGHKNRAEELLSPIIRQVNFSLQSWASNFPGRDVGEYLQPIFRFTNRAMELRPDLYINYRLWNLVEPGVAVGAGGLACDIKDPNALFMNPIYKEFGFKLGSEVNVASRKSYRVRGRLYLHFDSRFDWPNLNGPILGESGFCYGLKSHFAIHADGTVVPCCLDKEANIRLGTVSVADGAGPAVSDDVVCVGATAAAFAVHGEGPSAESLGSLSILRALNSKRAVRLREGFDQFELREDLCRRCSFIRRFKKKN